MKPSMKITKLTILGAVVGALLGIFYILFTSECFVSEWFIKASGTGAIAGALVFSLISIINEITKKKNRLVRRLGLVILITIAVITIAFILIFVISPILPMIFFSIKQKCF